jgi:hypothetical protein
MYGDFPAKHTAYTPYTYKCIVLANPSYEYEQLPGYRLPLLQLYKSCVRSPSVEAASATPLHTVGSCWLLGQPVLQLCMFRMCSQSTYRELLSSVWCNTRTPVLVVKQRDVTHITLAIHLCSSQVSPSFYLLINNPSPSHDANVIKPLLLVVIVLDYPTIQITLHTRVVSFPTRQAVSSRMLGSVGGKQQNN